MTRFLARLLRAVANRLDPQPPTVPLAWFTGGVTTTSTAACPGTVTYTWPPGGSFNL